MHTRTVLREADSLLGISDDLRKRMIAMGAPAARTHTVVSGCDLSVFHPRDRSDARRKLGVDPSAEAVVYIGRMDLRKGLQELIDAAVSLHAKRERLHLYLVGDGRDEQVIERSLQASNTAGYIHKRPVCVFGAVADWMTAANLVTLPSYNEGYPNVLVEALASGRPVVATKIGGIPEIVCDECGMLVPPRDSAALAEALASALDKSWNAETISAHRSRSWDAVAAELLQLFESLVKARS